MGKLKTGWIIILEWWLPAIPSGNVKMGWNDFQCHGENDMGQIFSSMQLYNKLLWNIPMKSFLLQILLFYVLSRKFTLCGTFSICACKGDNSFVNLDSRNDSFILQNFDKWNALLRTLVECLVEQNNTADVFCDRLVSWEQQLSVSPSVLLRVLYSNRSKSLTHRSWKKMFNVWRAKFKNALK